MTETPMDDEGLQSLYEQRGGEYDSSGQFTLAPHLAIKKLANYQLADPSIWILKVVQAAVAGESQSITVRQGRVETSFTFAQPGLEFSLDALKSALGRPEPTGARHLDHLVVALRTVGAAQSRPWRLTSVGAGRREQLLWNGEEFESQTDSDCAEANTVRLVVEFRPDQRRPRVSSILPIFDKGIAVAEYLQLVERAHVCPIPLTFDGRRLDRGRFDRELVLEGQVANLCFGFEPPSDDPSQDNLPLPAGFDRDGWRPSDRLMDGRFFYIDGELEQLKTSVFFHISYAFYTQSFLGLTVLGSRGRFEWTPRNLPSACHWVNDGVVVETTSLNIGRVRLGVDFYFSAHGLSTDVSGLSLRKTSENANLMEQRRIRGLTRAARSAIATKEALASAWVKPFFGDAVYTGMMATPFLYGALTMVPFMLLMATPLGLLLATSAAEKKKIIADILTELDRLAKNVCGATSP